MREDHHVSSFDHILSGKVHEGLMMLSSSRDPTFVVSLETPIVGWNPLMVHSKVFIAAIPRL